MSPESGNTAAIDAALAAMRARYAETSRGFISMFDLIGQQLATTPESDALLTSLRRELHRVHGTAGSLGFHEAGRIAGAMEDLVRRWCADGSLDRERRSSIVLRFARALERAIEFGRTGDGGARNIVLVDIPASIAVGLVAEGIHRGFAVERLTESAATGAQRTVSPWGVLAMESGGPLISAAGLSDVPFVLLREPHAGGRRSSASNMIDAACSAGEILDLLAHQHGRGTAAAGTVLLVDDDPMMHLLLRTLAEHEGFVVEEATSEESFREGLLQLDPALVVLDIELRDTSGFDLLRTLRSSARHRDVPVLMLSGRSDAEARTHAFEAGADDYMVKPVVPAEFRHRIVQLVGQQHERRAATGLHPSSGLPLQARTMQEIESRLASRGETGWSVAVLRPVKAPEPGGGMSAWEEECVRVAAAARDAGGIAGLTTESELAIALPLAHGEAELLIAGLAGNDSNIRWYAGIVATSALPAPTLRAMLAAADDACIAARDAGVSVRVWDPSDVDIAPDVIIVEDDEALAELLAFALTARGLSHRCYHSGPEGLAALLRLKVHDKPRIVLLDIDLPGMDGHSLHERLRLERPGCFHVVFLSLHTSESDQLRALQGGALDYLTKPVSVRVLMAKLAAWRERTRTA